MCWCLAGSKWGSHIPVPGTPLYVTDTLLLAGLAAFVVSSLSPSASRRQVSNRSVGLLILGAFLLWAVIRLLTSPWDGLTTLRDFAPYGYLGLAFVTAAAYPRSSPADRLRSARWLEVALFLHLSWVLPVSLLQDPTSRVYSQTGVALFQPRNDIDLGVLGILLGLALARVLTGKQVMKWSVIALATFVAMVPLSSRAGLLSLLAGCGLVMYAAGRSREFSTSRRLAVSLMIPVFVGALLVGLASTSAGDRLKVSVGMTPTSQTSQGASGTAYARSLTWSRVIQYTEEEQRRELIGVGFGPDFLTAAGATDIISGAEWKNVRSPHNWFVGTFARLGAIGLLLALALTLSVMRTVWRLARVALTNDLLLLASLTAVGMLIMATLGVILESPFGAVPFSWAAGILFGFPFVKTARAASEDSSPNTVADRTSAPRPGLTRRVS